MVYTIDFLMKEETDRCDEIDLGSYDDTDRIEFYRGFEFVD